MKNPEMPSDSVRGLAPSATPAVVYGFLAFTLCAVPIVGALFGYMAFFRSQQAAIQLESDPRLEGQGLQRAGLLLGIVGLGLGSCSTIVWSVIMIVYLAGY